MQDSFKNNPLLAKPTNFSNVKCVNTKLDVINTTNARLPHVQYHDAAKKVGFFAKLFGSSKEK